MSVFDRDTAVEPLGPRSPDGACFTASLEGSWWGGAGLHGGYVAAVVLRAMLETVDDPARPPRSLTLHYARAPDAGPVEVEVTVEKAGRSASTLTARVGQDGRVAVIALGTFAGPYPEGLTYEESEPPAVAAPAGPRRAPERPDIPAFAAHLDLRPFPDALPYAGAERALAGGWLRLAEPHPIDAPAVALLADAYWPAPFARLRAPTPAPTLDLTIHFRRSLPLALPDPHPFLLARFRSRLACEGFFEEDGELWAPDGRLVAQSRQLALLLPRG